MSTLSPDGNRLVEDLSARHGFSVDAVTHMLIAVLNGNGSMAQFSHPEFGGSGQWMRGGMTMVGNLFDNQMKYRVDSLCAEISSQLNNHGFQPLAGSFQSQNQSGSGNMQAQTAGGGSGTSSLFLPDPSRQWWPSELGSPSATGSQNNARYAYFANARRLAVATGNQVWVYDTQDHQIGGFSQQQGAGGSITFTSQYGTVNLSSLPVVTKDGQPVEHHNGSVAATPASESPTDRADESQPSSTAQPSAEPVDEDILDKLHRLGELKEKGYLTDDEFLAKKTELLSRL